MREAQRRSGVWGLQQKREFHQRLTDEYSPEFGSITVKKQKVLVCFPARSGCSRQASAPSVLELTRSFSVVRWSHGRLLDLN